MIENKESTEPIANGDANEDGQNSNEPRKKAADEERGYASNEEKFVAVDDEVATEGTDCSVADDNKRGETSAVVSSNKKSRPAYKYDPNKITLRFLFANRDGLTVTIECEPSNTVGETKGALLSVWPEDLPDCTGGDRIRLICMGKGILMPDSRTLADCQIPVFKAHPTPINVSIRPESMGDDSGSKKTKGAKDVDASSIDGHLNSASQTSQGCGCVIL